MKLGTRFVALRKGALAIASSALLSQAASFSAESGNYGGLIDPGVGADPDNSGIIQIQLTPSGFFSGAVTWQNQRYPMVGRLADNGTFSRTFTKSAASKGGVVPNVPLVLGSDDNFYGTTYFGGANGIGTVFRMTPEGVVTNLVSFSGATIPSRLFTFADIISLLLNRKGQPVTVIRKIPFPNALVQGSDGYFYGTTQQGGPFGEASGTYGTIYRMTSAGVRETLVNFAGNRTVNKGAGPQSALVEGPDGNFYGTTQFGDFHGTVFRMTPAGELTTLVTFTGDDGASKGSHPFGALLRASDGNFYGTTREGGANGLGTIFKLTPQGSLTTLVEFTGNGLTNKGSSPYAALVQGADGNLYGTTELGGSNDFGTIFKLTTNGTPQGTTLTTLAEFTGGGGAVRGSHPVAALIEASAGVFLGAAGFGSIGTVPSDSFSGNGTIFKITSAGVFETLVDFTGDAGSNKGSNPSAALIRGNDGNFYGTTAGGGANFGGTIFKMTAAGALTTLVEFKNEPGKFTVSLTLDQNSRTMSGQLIDTTPGGPSVVFPFTLDGAPPNATLATVYPPGIRISFIDPPDASTNTDTEPPPTTTDLDPTPIFGDGFAQIAVGKTAQRFARVVGRLPDYDGAYSAGSPMRGTKYTLFSPLYKRQKAYGGQLFGLATVADTGGAASFKADLRWGKREGYDPGFHFGKIDLAVQLDAGPYLRAGGLPPIIPIGTEGGAINARLTFRRGNIRIANNGVGNDLFFGVDIAISKFGARVIGANPNRVALRVNAGTGGFSGTFVHPVFRTKTNFQGAFEPAVGMTPGIGRGSFRPEVSDETLATLSEPLVSGGVTILPD